MRRMPRPAAFRWNEEVSGYAAVLDGVTPSQRLTVEGTRFDVPTRADYEAALRQAGVLGAGEGWVERPELVAAVQAHWHAGGDDPCVFAQYMSTRRDVHGWETFVLADHGSVAADADAVDELTTERVAAPEAEVVSVLLPHGDSPAYLAGLLARLALLDAWEVCDEGAEDDPELGRLVRLGLRVKVEFGYGSEVLGFGPYAGLAYSRQAPFTELAIRAKPPRKPRRDKRAFMAHVDIFPPLDNPDMKEWWDRTEQNRRGRLGERHDARGKARVVFALPGEEWRRQTQ